MERKTTATRAGLMALTALVLASIASSVAMADTDKGKDKGKKGPVVVIGPITKTDDPAPKKK